VAAVAAVAVTTTEVSSARTVGVLDGGRGVVGAGLGGTAVAVLVAEGLAVAVGVCVAVGSGVFVGRGVSLGKGVAVGKGVSVAVGAGGATATRQASSQYESLCLTANSGWPLLYTVTKSLWATAETAS